MTDSKIKKILKEKVRANKFLILKKDESSVTIFLVCVAKIGRKHFLFEIALRKGRGLKRIDFITVKSV